jgi:hypothetical protein
MNKFKDFLKMNGVEFQETDTEFLLYCPFCGFSSVISPMLCLHVNKETGSWWCGNSKCENRNGEFSGLAERLGFAWKDEQPEDEGKASQTRKTPPQAKQDKKREVEIFTEGEMQKAKAFLNSPTLLFNVIKAMGDLKIAGEKKNGLLLYIVLTSRLLDSPISVIAKGDSSAGKSYLVGQMLKLFPKAAYVDLTDATPRSFFYVEPDYYKHRIIVVFEKHGVDQANYSIRSLQSEKVLKLQVTTKDKDGNFVSKEKIVEGPMGLITTTTESKIHPENETRCLSLYIDDSRDQTQLVFEMADSKYRGIQEMSDMELRIFRAAQTMLKPYPVFIPYVAIIRELFPKTKTRTRRDYPQFLSLMEASTFLHQYQRQRKIINGKEYLVASLADYNIAYLITKEMLAHTIFEIPPKSEQLVEAAKSLGEPFTVHQLASAMGWDYDVTLKWFKAPRNSGYFEEVDAHRGPHAATYRLSGKEIEEIKGKLLPPVSDLAEKNPDAGADKSVYDPLTGEIMEI